MIQQQFIFPLAEVIGSSTTLPTWTICFSKDKLILSDNIVTIAYDWNTLKDLTLKVVAYAHKSRGTDDPRYDGDENFISFNANGTMYKFHFFIRNSYMLNRLAVYLRSIILPLLRKLKTIKSSDVFISDLTYIQIQDIKKQLGI